MKIIETHVILYCSENLFTILTINTDLILDNLFLKFWPFIMQNNGLWAPTGSLISKLGLKVQQMNYKFQ